MSERRSALITGSARGIGQAIAKRLAKEGINIAVNDICSKENAQETVDMCRKEGVEAYFFEADISNAVSRKELVTSIKRQFGRLDILVNNAGVAPKERKGILEATEESFDRVLNINLKGPYFLTQLISRWMIEQKRDHPDREPFIVNISSVSAFTSSPNRGEYCISKAGVSMTTKLYADRLAEYGIHVYEVRPGIINTDMTTAVKDKYDQLFNEGLTPIARWGQPEDVADVVAGFAKGLYKYSTGEVIHVDGGFHLRRL
ncbi:3-ketoacyl-ACP reductase [Candidatus Bipolaricaulota bacterium]|nr:3-ketoacyl-ACP reductase [Candidatus Bipolaricaulota bacterium]